MLQDLKQIKTDEYKQKNPNGLLPAVKIEGDFYYESGAIMQIILEKFPIDPLMPAPNTKQRGAHDNCICMQATPVCLPPCIYPSNRICIQWTRHYSDESDYDCDCVIGIAICMEGTIQAVSVFNS